MNTFTVVFRELIGLFVDDGSLALQIVVIVVIAMMSTTQLPSIPLAAGAILVVGCLGVLLLSVATACRHQRNR
jgi:hypothetical protein